MTVNRADIVEAELLEQSARHHHAFHVLLPAPGEGLHGWKGAEDRFASLTDRGVSAA